MLFLKIVNFLLVICQNNNMLCIYIYLPNQLFLEIASFRWQEENNRLLLSVTGIDNQGLNIISKEIIRMLLEIPSPIIWQHSYFCHTDAGGTEHLFDDLNYQNVHQLALNQFGISNKMMQYRMQFGFAFLLPISKRRLLICPRQDGSCFFFLVLHSKKFSFKIV